MFLLPTWMPNLKPSTEMTSSSPSSEAVTMTTSASSSSSSPALSHSESAFAAYKTMNDTAAAAAAATTSFLSLHPPPPPTLQSSILEHTASMQRSLWQKLLPTDAISAAAAAAVAAAVGTHHPGPSHATWNQELLSSHHYANSGGAFADLPMDGGFPRSKNGARESTGTLKAWLCRNLKNPYPSKGEKIMLAIITRMTLTQVSTWFANARRRLKKERTFRWTVDDDDDDDYSDEYNNDDKDDDGRELQLLDDDDDDDDESLVMNRTRGLKKKRPESPDFCCASKRRRCEDRPTSKRKRRSGQTEETKTEDVGTLRSLTLTWTESRAEGDDNKPPSSPLGSLSCSSRSSSSSSPPSSLPSLTSTRCLSSDQQVVLDETKRSDVAPSGSTCFIQAQTSIDAATAAVDLSITSKTNTTASSSSSSSSSATSSASTSTVKPRIWSIVEIATT